MIININIDKLVLEGLELQSDQIPAFQNALKKEITRQFIDHGIETATIKTHSTDRVEPLLLKNNADLHVQTRQIAQHILSNIVS